MWLLRVIAFSMGLTLTAWTMVVLAVDTRWRTREECRDNLMVLGVIAVIIAICAVIVVR